MGLSGFGMVGSVNKIQPYKKIGKRIDNLAISNPLNYGYVEFCFPSPGVRFHESTEPPRNTCGSYTRNLDNFPLNQATIYETNTGYWTFGQSEMVLCYVRLDNYPRTGGYVQFNCKRPDGSIYFTITVPLGVPQPDWEYWYGFAWAVVGKFSADSGFSTDEIIYPGTYTIQILTPWGGSTIDFAVTGEGYYPPPPFSISAITATMNNVNEPRTRTITVTGQGTGAYQVIEDFTVIASRTLTDGFDTFTVQNISPGSHIYCTSVFNKCTAFTVQDLPPSCPDNLTTNLVVTVL